MISSNSISAPQIANGTLLYTEWKASNTGTLQDYYEFLTTPSPERDLFLEGRREEMEMSGDVLIHTFNGLPGTVVTPVVPPGTVIQPAD